MLFILILILLLKLTLITSKMTQTWSNRLGLSLTPISKGLWSADRPFIWNNIDVGGRSVIARLSDKNKSLMVHSPVKWDEELGECIKNLGGEIKYIITPSYEHLKYAKQWSEIYQNAIMVGCPGIKNKVPNVDWRELFDNNDNDNDNDEKIELKLKEDGVECVWLNCESFLNKPFFQEVVFHHISSSTYITADSFWNYPSNKYPNYSYSHSGSCNDNKNDYKNDDTEDQSSSKEDIEIMSIKVHKCSQVVLPQDTPSSLPPISVPLGTKLWKFGMDKIYKPFYNNIMVGRNELSYKRINYVKAIDTILDWEVEVIAPCHGDVVRGKELCKRVLNQHYYP